MDALVQYAAMVRSIPDIPMLIPHEVRVLDIENTVFSNGLNGNKVTVGYFRGTKTIVTISTEGLYGYRGNSFEVGDCLYGQFFRPLAPDEFSILVSAQRMPSALIGPELIPSVFAYNPQDLESLVARVGQVNDYRLRSLLRQVFAEQVVWERYGYIPASKQWHHNYPGGNLRHCLEVVENALQALEAESAIDRDLVIVGGLLHDLGKVLVYESDGSGTATGTTSHHENLTIELLATPLKVLERQAGGRVLANKLRSILYPSSNKGRYGYHWLRDVLHRADGLSAANDGLSLGHVDQHYNRY